MAVFSWHSRFLSRAAGQGRPLLILITASGQRASTVLAERLREGKWGDFVGKYWTGVIADRETWPEVDYGYQTAAALLHPGPFSGAEVHPLAFFATPEGFPFFWAEGWTAEPGEEELLARVTALWLDAREAAEQAAAELRSALDRLAGAEAAERGRDRTPEEKETLLERTLAAWAGGETGTGFPWTLWRDPGRPETLSPAARRHLERGLSGWVASSFDPVHGGFYEGAVSGPFEGQELDKTLARNALYAGLFLDHHRRTGDPAALSVARETLEFLERELSSPGGGFAAGLGSPAETGGAPNYTWTREELARILPAPDEGSACGRLLGLKEGAVRTVPSLAFSLSSWTRERNQDRGQAVADFRRWRETLRASRTAVGIGVRPGRDARWIVSWNGLAVSAFSRAYALTGEARWRKAAEQALARIPGPVLPRFLSGEKGTGERPPALEDYAFWTAGLLDAYEAFGENALRTRAEACQAQVTVLGLEEKICTGAGLPLSAVWHHDTWLPSPTETFRANAARLAG